MSGFVTDLLGVSARRMLQALADGETDPAALAALADKHLRATPAQLCDALGACTELHPVYRRLIKMALQELQFLEQQMGQLDQEIANLLRPHEDAVKRLAEVPGLGVDSAQQIIAEVGPTVATLPSDKQLCSWVQSARGTTRAGESTTATVRRRAIARCGAFSIKLPMLQPGPKEAFSRSYIAVRSRAWDIIKPSA